ncbi:MAG: hypothetical protein AUJ82_07365 [Verrucomicrobia bacterium CG1_02_43_26]|nr:MAG: hypothetical protein AUJ82_07365 [Verrucomicrobia bacterium CG1_02_43_26]
MRHSFTKKTGWLKDFLLELAALWITWIYFIYYSTLRVEVINSQFSPRKFLNSFNAIYVVWHGKTFVPLMLGSYCRMGSITLPDWKNAIYWKIRRHLGYQSAPVTVADKSMFRLKKMLKQGSHVTVVADGIVGQFGLKKAGYIKPGALYLAAKTSKPIVAVRQEISKGFRLKKRWDQYEVPYPFSRVTVWFSNPIYTKNEAPDQIETKLRQALGHF